MTEMTVIIVDVCSDFVCIMGIESRKCRFLGAKRRDETQRPPTSPSFTCHMSQVLAGGGVGGLWLLLGGGHVWLRAH